MRLASLTPPRGERHALLPKPPERKSLARISLRARHPLLPNAELGTSTSLTAAASSAFCPLGRSAEGLLPRPSREATTPTNDNYTWLEAHKMRLTDRKKLPRETRNKILPESNDLSTLLTISFPRHYFSKLSCN